MDLITKVEDFIKVRAANNFSRPVGFVPTMGALHGGHLSLIDQMCKECDLKIVSIFINPLQFNSSEDLKSYPRNLERDMEILKNKPVDIVFAPNVDDMYPLGVNDNFKIGIPDHLLNRLCGRTRKGHFEGVCQILCKLFNLVKCDKTYFGQKDFQQAKIIENMIKDLFYDISINVLPTVRDQKGVALSSRNFLIDEVRMDSAQALNRVLEFIARLIKNGECDSIKLKKAAKEFLSSFPDFTLEYIEILDAYDLRDLKTVDESDNVLIAVAGYVGDVRLIDNIIL